MPRFAGRVVKVLLETCTFQCLSCWWWYLWSGYWRIPYIPSSNSSAARRMILSRVISESCFTLGFSSLLDWTSLFYKQKSPEHATHSCKVKRAHNKQYGKNNEINSSKCEDQTSSGVFLTHLNSFFIAGSFHYPVYIYGRDVNVFRTKTSNINNLLNLCTKVSHFLFKFWDQNFDKMSKPQSPPQLKRSQTSTIVTLAALHIGWLKLRVVFLFKKIDMFSKGE